MVTPKGQRILFVMALAEEGVVLPTNAPVLLTGIGKINAAMRLSQWLATRHNDDVDDDDVDVDLVVNLGSAGGVGLVKGQTFAVNQVTQFDMDLTALGFDKHATPFDDLDKRTIITADIAEHLGLAKAPCFTSDRFVAGADLPPAPALVDMECFALAKTCAMFDVPFASIKYVTDQADASADTDWGENLQSCGEALSAVAKTLVG